MQRFRHLKEELFNRSNLTYGLLAKQVLGIALKITLCLNAKTFLAFHFTENFAKD
jgi:hypothetical protein